MSNNELKQEIRNSKVAQWKIAAKIGVCEMTVVRWLRLELPEEKKQVMLQAIKGVKEEEILGIKAGDK